MTGFIIYTGTMNVTTKYPGKQREKVVFMRVKDVLNISTPVEHKKGASIGHLLYCRGLLFHISPIDINLVNLLSHCNGPPVRAFLKLI